MKFIRSIERRLGALDPQTQDVLLSITVGLLTLLIASQTISNGEHAFGVPVRSTDVGAVMFVVGPSVVLCIRRRWPIGALVLGTTLQMLVWAAGYNESMIALTILIAGAGFYGGRAGLRTAIQSAVLLTAWTGVGVIAGAAPPLAIPTVGFYTAFAATFGQYAVSRADLAAALRETEQEMQRRREADSVRVRQQEQNRLARELHDVVAHNLSVIAVQAGAARRVHDPDQAAESLLLVETTARRAMDEMREVVGALRTNNDVAWTPTQSLDDVGHLVDQMEAAGLTIRPTIDVPSNLSLATQVSGYRLVQESLTNALKHGGAGTVVDLTIQAMGTSGVDPVLGICVADDGGTPDGRISFDPGHGLRGMKERVALLGGSFAAGRRSAGGFEVKVRLPIDPVNQ